VFGCVDDLLAVTLVNESCSPEWKIYKKFSDGGNKVLHMTARTLEQCQYACVFNPGCVGVSWPGNPVKCYLYSNLRYSGNHYPAFNTYELVRRCNITAGSFFIDINVKKTFQFKTQCKGVKSHVTPFYSLDPHFY